MKYLPYVPLAIAIVVALTLGDTEDPARRNLATGWVALLLGATMALSGMRAITRGRVLVRTRRAAREEQPATFWTAVILFRFGLAVLFVAVGVWTLL